MDGKIIKNSIFNFIKTLSSMLFPIVTFSYAARILGVEGVGKVNFAKSIITYFSMFAVLGVNFYGTREAAKVRDDKNMLSKYVHEMLMINGVTTCLSYLALFICIEVIPRFYDYRFLLIVNSITIALQGIGMEWLYQAIEEYRYIAIRSVLFQQLAMILMFFGVTDSKDIVPYAAISILATSGSYILNFIHIRKYISFQWYGHYNIKKHIKPLLYFFSTIISIEIYTVLDSTMLGFLQGDIAVGKYTAAVKVNKMVINLITSLGIVLIPRLSYYIEQGQEKKVKLLIEKAYNCVFLLSIPASIGLYVLSNEIMLLFSGKEFSSATFTMKLLTPLLIIIPFSAVTNHQIFVPMKKEKIILKSTIFGAVTNFVGNLLLIPYWKENGAAVSTVLAEMAVSITCFYYIRRYFDMKQIFRNYYQYWVASITVLGVTMIFNHFNINYIIRMIFIIIFSAISYSTVLLLQKNTYIIGIIDFLLKREDK